MQGGVKCFMRIGVTAHTLGVGRIVSPFKCQETSIWKMEQPTLFET